MSESKQDDESRAWWKEVIKSWRYVRRFDAALVGGSPHRRYLERLGMPPERIFTGYDVVDNDYFARGAARAREDAAQARMRQSAIPRRPYFLSATRFIPRKNGLILIRAYAEYRIAVGDENAWDLVVCGSGEEKAAIVSLIEELGVVDYVHLPGFVMYGNIPDWYGLASAFVHPALQEQWGLVVNEAMASALPVLVSNRCGCYPDLVREGVTGLGFDPEAPEQITAALLRVSTDKVLRQGMAGAAALHIGHFTQEHFGEGMVRAVVATSKAHG